jgi:hypothetical protein
MPVIQASGSSSRPFSVVIIPITSLRMVRVS